MIYKITVNFKERLLEKNIQQIVELMRMKRNYLNKNKCVSI